MELTPHVDEVWPAYSHCVQASPEKTTTYTLTARDAAGHSESKTVEVTVGAAAAPKSAGGRLIQEVNVSSLQVAAGGAVTVCYMAKNATSVKIVPGESAPDNPNKGCVVDHPSKTTTYVVTATGAGGAKDVERVTVKVQ